MKADLHLHSTASDGLLAPSQLVFSAAQNGFTLLALTDHDSVDGIAEAVRAADECGLRVIPGVELSCGAQKEIHLLGYGFDPENERLLSFCREQRSRRTERIQKMIRLLEQLGKPVSGERVRELAGGVIGRPHIARAMVEAGYVSSVSEAFDRYLAAGKCAYVPREEIRVPDAVRLIHDAGGAAVLAHPMELKMGETLLASLVGEWKAEGLDGIEVWHPSAQNNHAAFLLRLARSEGMLVTGGSDFHGESMHRGRIGEGLDRWKDAADDVQALLKRCGLL